MKPTLVILAILAGFAGPLRAQSAPIVDSIAVVTHDIFDSSEVAINPALSLANGLHVATRPYVVRRELLFRAGQPFDIALVDETLRNLRAMGLFRLATADTFRVDGRLVTRIQTHDGWTTSLELNGRSTGTEFTWSTGITELNLLGTGNLASLRYRHDDNRTSYTGVVALRRMFGTPVRSQAYYSKLSDGHQVGFQIGSPFRAFSDRKALDFGIDAERRRLYRYHDGLVLLPADREVFQSRSVRASGVAAVALRAESRGFLRLQFGAMVRNQRYVRAADTLLAVSDSVTSAVATSLFWQHARFAVMTHLNGFQQEDVNLSSRLRVGAWVAPAAFGYLRSGIGPFIEVRTGTPLGRAGRGFVRWGGEAHGLFNSAGLDSGVVSSDLTVAVRPAERHATVLFLFAGSQSRPQPGYEFDLGHVTGPRAFGSHAFTGTRAVWGSIEQRAFLFDELFNVMGLGFAAFFDYGGAWYPNEPSRWGGNVGAGIRLGATRATGANLGRFDLAYRFGDIVPNDKGRISRWVFSFGRAFVY